MKKLILFSSVMLIGCVKHGPVHAPAGKTLSEEDLNVSRNRIKNLNNIERGQIEDWIKDQDQLFYPMTLNYWVDDAALPTQSIKKDGESVSYEYDIYDFDRVKLYAAPKRNMNAVFGRFVELKPVEDALRHMHEKKEITLLIPSSLAFGTYGDNDKIPNDMPLLIKLRLL